MNNKDTIASIITPYGDGAVSIIRISGNKTFKIINKIFKNKDINKLEKNTINYGYIYNNNEIIDEVLLSKFVSPFSYTGEDTIEINCHGGNFVTNKILELIISNGVRLANNGEFTLRAFMNGKIDLTKAESIMGMIESKNERSYQASIKGIENILYKEIKKYRENLLEIIANIEVNIDYPEYEDVEMLTKKTLLPKIESLKEELSNVIEATKITNYSFDGIDTVIIGRPNVGKSSLINLLSGEDLAIVSDIEGTTRDSIKKTISLNNVKLNLIDTAGIRNSNDEIEQKGVELSLKHLNKAELVLLLLDGSKKLNVDDKKIINLTENMNRIVIKNKSDLNLINEFKEDILLSTISGNGIIELKKLIEKKFKLDSFNINNNLSMINTRQLNLVKEANLLINNSINELKNNQLIDMVEIDLKEAWNKLGEIIGENTTDSLLDELFSKFCLGK